MDNERKDYLKQYKKDNLKRIVLNVKKDEHDLIKKAAETNFTTAGRYIKSLIEKDLKAKGLTVKKDTVSFVVATDTDVSSPMDYFRKNTPDQKLERVMFTDIDKVTGKNHGIGIALLTPEEAAKYREAQKEKAAQDKT